MKNLTKLVFVVLLSLTMIQCKNSNENSNQTKNTTEQVHSEKEDKHEHNPEDDLQYVSKEFKVTGDVVTPLTLTVDSLKQMDVKEFTDFKIVCQSGITKDSIKSTKGVLLTDILDKAKIDQKKHKDRNFSIVARASDDYIALFSFQELYNNPVGEQVYVLFEQNGEPLLEKGEMILVSLSDTKTGPRHVKWLSSIEVKRAE